MTEELSPILEDTDPKMWADEIRHIKIRELDELLIKPMLISDRIRITKKLEFLINYESMVKS